MKGYVDYLISLDTEIQREIERDVLDIIWQQGIRNG